jgi:hypothetical protein
MGRGIGNVMMRQPTKGRLPTAAWRASSEPPALELDID